MTTGQPPPVTIFYMHALLNTSVTQLTGTAVRTQLYRGFLENSHCQDRTHFEWFSFQYINLTILMSYRVKNQIQWEIEVTTVTKKLPQTFVHACDMKEGCIPLSQAYNKSRHT